MPIIVKGGNGGTFAPAPAGLHQGVCVDVVDMGVMEVIYAGKTKKQHKIRIIWQLDQTMEDLRPFIVQKRYTASLHEKSTLRKELESWRGRPFTSEELDGFDMERLLGANAQLNIQHAVKEGTTYANVVTLVPLGRGMAKIEPRGYVRVKDRTDAEQASDANEDAGPLTVEDIPF